MKYKICTYWLLLLNVVCITATAQTPLKTRDVSITGPQTFAIVLGISKYKYIRPLTYADKDAELFRDYLKSPAGGSVKPENIFTLLNEQALNSTFWTKGFQWLKAKGLRKGDRLFIYLAGHGDAIDQDEFFFLSYDCNPQGDKNNYLAGGAIQLYNLKKKIANETSKGVEVFFIMDACRSNELPGGTEGQNFLNTAISEKKAGEVIMLATGAGQESLEDASIGNGHGLFTYYLVDGLTGVADTDGTPDSKVTFAEIKEYVGKNVPIIAQQRFKRKQDPYLCCNEAGAKVIGQVDAPYLQKWLDIKKKSQRNGGGNSFTGSLLLNKSITADTSLLETYNAFYKAIKNKKLTGGTSAEAYYQQLEKKFPGNPYTSDAKSTLADELIKHAQDIVNNYLSCTELSAAQRKENFDAGLQLEKAIKLVEDADYARTLIPQMNFLKASGDYGLNGQNGSQQSAFQYAYNALAAEPNGAYIQNRLALLHLENNRQDSAKYYAEKATRTAPKWLCALATLSLVQNKTAENKMPGQPKKKPPFKNGYKKFQFGGVVGGGISQYQVTTVTPTANDTLRSASVTGRTKYDLGLTGQINISDKFSIRPSVLVSVENSDIVYQRRDPFGTGTLSDIVPVKTMAISLPVPMIIRFNTKRVSPFISAGPVFSFINQKSDANSAKLGVKPFDVLADAGFGVDIGLLKSHLIISPEIKYSRGLLDVKESNDVSYSRLISKLNRQAFVFSIYVRAR